MFARSCRPKSATLTRTATASRAGRARRPPAATAPAATKSPTRRRTATSARASRRSSRRVCLLLCLRAAVPRLSVLRGGRPGEGYPCCWFVFAGRAFGSPCDTLTRHPPFAPAPVPVRALCVRVFETPQLVEPKAWTGVGFPSATSSRSRPTSSLANTSLDSGQWLLLVPHPYPHSHLDASTRCSHLPPRLSRCAWRSFAPTRCDHAQVRLRGHRPGLVQLRRCHPGIGPTPPMTRSGRRCLRTRAMKSTLVRYCCTTSARAAELYAVVPIFRKAQLNRQK